MGDAARQGRRHRRQGKRQITVATLVLGGTSLTLVTVLTVAFAGEPTGHARTTTSVAVPLSSAPLLDLAPTPDATASAPHPAPEHRRTATRATDPSHHPRAAGTGGAAGRSTAPVRHTVHRTAPVAPIAPPVQPPQPVQAPAPPTHASSGGS